MSEQAPSSAPVTADTSSPVTESQSSDTSVSLSTDTQGGTPDAATLQAVAENGTPKQAAAAKKMLKQLRIKVDGVESTEDLPFEISEEHAEYMTKQIQKARAGDKRLQQYSQLESEVGKFIKRLKDDPEAALSDPSIGVDVKKLAASVVEKEIKKSQLSPAEREKQELQDELKRLKDQTKKDKEEAEEREFRTKCETEHARIESEMVQALAANQLPKSSGAIKRMASYMLQANNEGIDLTIADLAPIVKAEMQQELQDLLSQLSEDHAETFIGKDIISKIRKKNISKAKSAGTANPKTTVKETSAKARTSEKPPAIKKNYKDFFGT